MSETLSDKTQSIPVAIRAAGILFLLCAVLSNIGAYRFGDQRILHVFTPGALGWIGSGILLFMLRERTVRQKILHLPGTILSVWGILFVIFLYHCIAKGFSLPEYLHLPGEELLVLSVPFLICVSLDACKKYITVCGAFFWTCNLLSLAISYLQGKPLWRHGIAGNENWAAALLWMGAPFFYLTFHDRCTTERCRRIFLGIIFTVPAVVTLCIGSKGAVLCGILCVGTALFFAGKKYLRIALILGVLCIFTAGAVWVRMHPEMTRELLMKDGRILLYESALSVIRNNALAGTSQGGYENQLMAHRSAEYFFIFNPAARSNHPHNHFLFTAGSWGIPALICFLLLLGIPLWKTARKLYLHQQCDPLEYWAFFVLLYGLLHGSLDLIMEVWPTQILGLIALGILLQKHTAQMPVVTREENENTSTVWAEKTLQYIFTLPAVILCASGGYCAWNWVYAQNQLTYLKEKPMTREARISLIRETAEKCPGNYQVNFVFLNLLERQLKDRETTLFVSDLMLKGNIPNYPGIRMARGNALLYLRRFPEAINEYQKEAELFPLTLRPVYNMTVAARAMGNHALAKICEKALLERMRLRNLDQNDLYKILRGKSSLDLRARYKP